MGWLRKQFKQKSTAGGLGMITYALGMYFGPGTVDSVMLALASAHGAYEAIRHEVTG